MTLHTDKDLDGGTHQIFPYAICVDKIPCVLTRRTSLI